MKIAFAIILILFAIASRFIPHAPNFTPLIAVALFAGAYLRGWLAYGIPLAILLVSDAILGFYGIEMFFTYGSYLLFVLLGSTMREKKTVMRVFGFSLLGAIAFFLITNFGVWVLGTMYVKSFTGLGECYAMGIPFFRNSLASTALYSALLFGLGFLAERTVFKRVRA